MELLRFHYCGFSSSAIKFKFLKVPLAFGGFQALMPLIGWLAGQTLQRFLANFDHWVAFGLLVFIGIRMIYEAFSKKECTNAIDPLNSHRLFGLSLATSIDALAVGITFAFLEIKLLYCHHMSYTFYFFGINNWQRWTLPCKSRSSRGII